MGIDTSDMFDVNGQLTEAGQKKMDAIKTSSDTATTIIDSSGKETGTLFKEKNHSLYEAHKYGDPSVDRLQDDEETLSIGERGGTEAALLGNRHYNIDINTTDKDSDVIIVGNDHEKETADGSRAVKINTKYGGKVTYAAGSSKDDISVYGDGETIIHGFGKGKGENAGMGTKDQLILENTECSKDIGSLLKDYNVTLENVNLEDLEATSVNAGCKIQTSETGKER